MIILNKVKQFRIEGNITQEELAAACRVSRQTVIAIEKGNYTPSLLLALQVAEFFKLPVEKVFELKDGYTKVTL